MDVKSYTNSTSIMHKALIKTLAYLTPYSHEDVVGGEEEAKDSICITFMLIDGVKVPNLSDSTSRTASRLQLELHCVSLELHLDESIELSILVYRFLQNQSKVFDLNTISMFGKKVTELKE